MGGGRPLWPQVDATILYERSHSPSAAVDTAGGGVAVAGPGSSSGGSPPFRELFQAGLDAAWELDVFGGVRRSIEAAQADLQASEEDRRDVLVTLVAEVGVDYVSLRGLQQQIFIARNNLKLKSILQRSPARGLKPAL